VEIAAVRGTRDILPPESRWWVWVEDAARRTCARYHYEEIRTPIFEQVSLFARGIGEVTDIVEKEMYTFADRGGRELALRPEGTAGVVRAVLEHKLYTGPLPVKLFYMGPMFRYERPQAGRYRQFTQFGVEVFGSDEPALDAEIISLGISFLEAIALQEWELRINSIGCPICRGDYRDLLRTKLGPHRDELCPSCQRRLDRNPLRVLDCKEEGCRRLTEDTPPMDEYLCPDCRQHWEAVQQHLTELGIPFRRYPRLVRGLDYYTRTVFELVAVGLGSQDAVLGGGRYDGLVEMMGGPSVPGIGFAAGLDRLLLSLQAAGALPKLGPEVDVYVARVGAVPEGQILKLVEELRRQGLRVDMDFLGRSLKTQLKTADRLQAVFTVVAGEGEWERGEVLLRRMSDGSQETLPRDGLAASLAERLATRAAG
jgi:histidyl-tRNA synthetase